MTRVVPVFALLMALAAQSLAATPPAGRAGETQKSLVPLVLVGPDTINIADLDAEISNTVSAGQGRAGLESLQAEAVLKRLIQNRLLEQEGYRTGADQAVHTQVCEFVRLRSVKALMDSVSAPNAKSPAAAEPVGMMNSMRRYSHILVADEATARSLRDSLSRGVDFADLARRHSSDGNARMGGDLGWAATGAYVEEFETAAGTLPLHGIAGPFKTQFGWHLVTLTEARTDTLKSESMANAMEDAQESKRRMEAVRQFVLSLRTKYKVTVSDSLLASLDYQSEKPEVQKQLQSSDAVLAVLPTGRLTVGGLTRNIRFQYFHGIQGRPEANSIRDRLFDEWVTEALLSYEAHALGLDQRPDLLALAKREERFLMREEVLKSIVTFDFRPNDGDIKNYYKAHLAEFTPAPRMKVYSALLPDEASANRFRAQLEGGVGFRWLAGRTPEASAVPAPFGGDWLSAAEIGLAGAKPVRGMILGPQGRADGWAVLQIVAVEEPRPSPLKECRDDVIAALRNEGTRRAIQQAVDRLEKATPITILSGAQAAVQGRIEHWRAAVAEGGRS